MSLVMVGDIIQMTEGMEVPADGLVLAASELTTDESAMTGETGNFHFYFLRSGREGR